MLVDAVSLAVKPAVDPDVSIEVNIRTDLLKLTADIVTLVVAKVELPDSSAVSAIDPLWTDFTNPLPRMAVLSSRPSYY